MMSSLFTSTYDLESYLALSSSLERSDSSKLSSEESVNNIYDNILQIIKIVDIKTESFGNQKPILDGGTGMLITTDGYFITNHHVVKDFIKEWKMYFESYKHMTLSQAIINYQKDFYVCPAGDYARYPRYSIYSPGKYRAEIYPGFAFTQKETDLALMKANIRAAPKSIAMKVKTSVREKEEIQLFSMKNNRTYSQFGKVINPSYDIQIPSLGTLCDTFTTDAHCIPYFSGGVFVNLEGELLGILSYGQRLHSFSGGIKIDKFISLVRKQSSLLARNLGIR